MVEGFLVGLLTTLAQAAPYVVLGYVIAAVIREFVPIEALTSRFGSSGPGPVLRAVTIGSLLPICSCGVVPLGVGLVRSGAAVGTTLAFMYSAPAISPVAVLLAWNVLGPTLTCAYVVAVLLGALTLGLVANKVFGGAGPKATLPPRISDVRPVRARVKSAARWAFWDLGTDVSVDLLLGLVVAAALLAMIPTDWVRSSLGQPGMKSLILAVVLAIPAYTCTVPAIPIVRSLLLLGVSPGAALVLLIAGPATNLGEINVIRGQIGGRAAAVYVAAIVGTALGGGLLVDRVLFPAYRYEAVEIAGQLLVTSCCVPMSFAAGEQPTLAGQLSSVPLWHVPFILVLSITLLVGLVRRVLRIVRPVTTAAPEDAPQPQEQNA